MKCRHAMGVAIIAATLLGGLGGCVRYYWSKPGASATDFSAASAECVKEGSPTTPTLKSGVFVHDLYRACLQAKGWVRDKQYDPPPPGWYRGVED